VRDLARRYQVSLAKEDDFYVYLDVKPLRKDGGSDFSRSRIVLVRNGYWMRQLWFQHPNGNEVTWDLDRPKTGTPITPASIRRGLPSGWRKMEMGRPRQDVSPP
jgi:hypothetical protein